MVFHYVVFHLRLARNLMRLKSLKLPTSTVVLSIYYSFDSIKDALQNKNLQGPKNCEFLGEYLRGFRHCDRLGRFRLQKILTAHQGLGAQPRNKAPGELQAGH